MPQQRHSCRAALLSAQVAERSRVADLEHDADVLFRAGRRGPRRRASRPRPVSGNSKPCSARSLPPAAGARVTVISAACAIVERDCAADLAIVKPDAIPDAHTRERGRQRAVNGCRGRNPPGGAGLRGLRQHAQCHSGEGLPLRSADSGCTGPSTHAGRCAVQSRPRFDTRTVAGDTTPDGGRIGSWRPPPRTAPGAHRMGGTGVPRARLCGGSGMAGRLH